MPKHLYFKYKLQQGSRVEFCEGIGIQYQITSGFCAITHQPLHVVPKADYSLIHHMQISETYLI